MRMLCSAHTNKTLISFRHCFKCLYFWAVWSLPRVGLALALVTYPPRVAGSDGGVAGLDFHPDFLFLRNFQFFSHFKNFQKNGYLVIKNRNYREWTPHSLGLLIDYEKITSFSSFFFFFWKSSKFDKKEDFLKTLLFSSCEIGLFKFN